MAKQAMEMPPSAEDAVQITKDEAPQTVLVDKTRPISLPESPARCSRKVAVAACVTVIVLAALLSVGLMFAVRDSIWPPSTATATSAAAVVLHRPCTHDTLRFSPLFDAHDLEVPTSISEDGREAAGFANVSTPGRIGYHHATMSYNVTVAPNVTLFTLDCHPEVKAVDCTNGSLRLRFADERAALSHAAALSGPDRVIVTGGRGWGCSQRLTNDTGASEAFRRFVENVSVAGSWLTATTAHAHFNDLFQHADIKFTAGSRPRTFNASDEAPASAPVPTGSGGSRSRARRQLASGAAAPYTSSSTRPSTGPSTSRRLSEQTSWWPDLVAAPPSTPASCSQAVAAAQSASADALVGGGGSFMDYVWHGLEVVAGLVGSAVSNAFRQLGTAVHAIGSSLRILFTGSLSSSHSWDLGDIAFTFEGSDSEQDERCVTLNESHLFGHITGDFEMRISHWALQEFNATGTVDNLNLRVKSATQASYAHESSGEVLVYHVNLPPLCFSVAGAPICLIGRVFFELGYDYHVTSTVSFDGEATASGSIVWGTKYVRETGGWQTIFENGLTYQGDHGDLNGAADVRMTSYLHGIFELSLQGIGGPTVGVKPFLEGVLRYGASADAPAAACDTLASVNAGVHMAIGLATDEFRLFGTPVIPAHRWWGPSYTAKWPLSTTCLAPAGSPATSTSAAQLLPGHTWKSVQADVGTCGDAPGYVSGSVQLLDARTPGSLSLYVALDWGAARYGNNPFVCVLSTRYLGTVTSRAGSTLAFEMTPEIPAAAANCSETYNPASDYNGAGTWSGTMSADYSTITLSRVVACEFGILCCRQAMLQMRATGFMPTSFWL